MIWILVALVSVAAAAALAWPLLRPRGATMPQRNAYDLAVYRDQLAEIERDHARGLLSNVEREAAKLEVERRMLAAAEAPAAAPTAPNALRRPTLAAFAVLIPAVALGLYLVVGSPSLGRLSSDATTDAAHRGEIVKYIERLAQHLKDNPTDARGWSMLGRSYALLGRVGDAIVAYERAEALAPQDADLLARHAEATIMAAGGTVNENAAGLIARALAIDAKEPRARFYQAMAEAQSGRSREALDLFVALEADTPPDAAWRPVVAARIEALARELNLDPAKLPGRAAPPTLGAERAPPPGMSDEDQQKMIRGMVAGLAARLAKQPNDADGWVRLGRSYEVLGEADKSRDAWRHAAELKPDDPRILAAYASAILQIGNAAAPPPEFTAVAAALLRLAPEDPDALWFAGVAARARGDRQSARAYWAHLLERLPAESSAREEIGRAIAELK